MDCPNTFGYEKRVKVSSWHDWMQAYPLDNPKPNYTGGSHYRSLGQTDEIFIPKTSTQELLDCGVQRKIYRTIARKQMDFESYPLNDLRLDSRVKTADEETPVAVSTTYQDNFTPKAPMVVKELCEDNPDQLMNRIPKCGFEYLPSSENKFMDDQLVNRSENRKKIDFFRQIRWDSGFLHWL